MTIITNPLIIFNGCDRVPEYVRKAIEARERSGRQKYSALLAAFHCLDLGDDHYIGVVGDPDNGGYEYFDFRDGKLITSNCGYGHTKIALRDALLRVYTLDSSELRNGNSGPSAKDEIS